MRLVANDDTRTIHDREMADGKCKLDEPAALTDVKIGDVGWLLKDCAYELCKHCFPEGG